MVICAGEILADMIGREENGRLAYERFAGGAPFNVACGLKQLGARCGFCGCVGDDLIGRYLIGYAENFQFDYLHIKKDKTRNTTLAFVELGANGERRFSFFRKNTADHALPQEAAEEIARAADILHIGSLPLSEEDGRSFADRAIALAHAYGKKVAFDVNYRDDLFESERQAADIYKKYIELADIVKFSEEEIPMFSGASATEAQMKDIAGQNKTVFLTLGAAGSMACRGGKIFSQPSIEITPVDTTGAGDAFMAGVLYALGRGETDMNAVLRTGNVCGALTASERGAVGALEKNIVEEKLRG